MPPKKIKMIVHDSVSRSIIMIDEKNLNVFIRDYTNDIKKRHDFFGYFVALITATLALLTADFHDAGLKAEVWQAIFCLADLWLLIMTIKVRYKTFLKKEMTPDELIIKIKNISEIKEEEVYSTTEFK